MGYRVRVTGSITFTPAMTWAEIERSPFYQPDPWSEVRRVVKVKTEKENVKTDEGVLQRITAGELVFYMEDSCTCPELAEHVQAFVEMHGEGREFSGGLDCEGEEQGDAWRLHVRDGQAVEVHAAMVWPEDMAYLVRSARQDSRPLEEVVSDLMNWLEDQHR